VMEMLNEVNVDKLKTKPTPMEKIAKFKKVSEKITNIPAKFKSKIIKLSRQQLDDYHTCPKKFYYAHILKIKLLENSKMMFGTAIHSALDHYFNKKIRDEKVTLQDLFQYYDEAFKNVGFITRKHEENIYNSGKETLVRFYSEDQKEKLIPNSVEESFEFIEGGIKINGRYDLVYKNNGVHEIRDFKTSSLEEQKDANRRIKESTQMMIYALAWYKKYKEIPKTTLYFIEPNLKGEIIFSRKDLEKTTEMIREVERELRANNMNAKPDERQCGFCPYKDICPNSAYK